MRLASSGVRSSRLGLSCWSDSDMAGAQDEAGATDKSFWSFGLETTNNPPTSTSSWGEKSPLLGQNHKVQGVETRHLLEQARKVRPRSEVGSDPTRTRIDG